MKRLFIFSGTIVIVLVAIVLFRTYTISDFQPAPIAVDTAGEINENALEHLGEALQFQTISHHPAMMDTEAFDGLGSWMRSTYPNVFSTMKVDTVGTHTYILKWTGENSDKPVLFMGHQDVVPVDASTKEEWTAGAFEGQIVNGYLYGRGALDDKGSVVGLLEAAESLCAEGFIPPQDYWYCFGQDEEIGGANGAELASAWFEENGIRFDWVLDEGGIISKGIIPGIEAPVALIGIAEKGYVSISIRANFEGGHSSMPRDTNAITLLSEAVNKLQNTPFQPSLDGPMDGFLNYIAPYSSFTLKAAASNRWLLEDLIIKTYMESPSGAALVRTTFSPTIIRAGVKDNVIPETAILTCNSRILPGQTADDVLQHYRNALSDLPVEVEIYDLAIDPSPVSPYESEAFSKIGSIARGTFAEEELIVAPYLVIGATDGRHMYNVSDQVYRFYPFIFESDDLKRLHGLNERISRVNFMKGIEFYRNLMSAPN